MSGWRGFVRRLFIPHHHEVAVPIDARLEASDRGIGAVKLSMLALLLTAAAQLGIAIVSGSVALLNDTVHNFADAFTALPLWIAFGLGRRPVTRRFPYGYGRFEDLAGVTVVLAIGASAAFALWEALDRLASPTEVRYLWSVIAASVLGFAGNELVARYRIRVGREIGSAALVADGLHARADGFTSLGVLGGAIGVALGFPRADALAGLLIGGMIVLLLIEAGHDVLLRLLDAIDPDLLRRAREALAGSEGMEAVGEVRIRWIGHRLHAEAEVTVNCETSFVDAHAIAEHAHHVLLHEVPHLASAIVHADPCRHDGHDHHAELVDHFKRVRAGLIPGP
jgi:cation diffusion facilitator family transporter